MSNTLNAKSANSDPCCCSPCASFVSYERPLFATGQTLTAADLTALTSYVAGKNRLHNRYLHGWGVVCGLEVVCDDCEGSVTIRPGYAIDPCGADIIVARPTRFDVVAAIRDCTGQGRQRTGDCDPWQPPADAGCQDALSHWCIALRYREVETAVGQRLTTGGSACVTVGKSAGSSGCGCGCGGSGGKHDSGGCGCGGGGKGGCQCGGGQVATSYTPDAVTASNACAPRRVMECYDISLVPSADGCVPGFDRLNRDTRSDSNPLGLIGWLIPERSLLRNIIDCLVADFKALGDGLSQTDKTTLVALFANQPGPLAQSNLQLDVVHAAVCHLRGVVLRLLQEGNSTRCQLLRAVAEVTLAPPTQADPATGIGAENRQDYMTRAKAAVMDLLAAWMQLVLDCICRAFLPRCEPDPCDERVEIACLTVKQGRIIDICNHSCRRYAGAFPSTFYWLSLVPIVPLIARMLAMVCCQPDLLRRNSPLVNDLIPLLATVDPSGKLSHAIIDDDFALPRRVLAALARFSGTAVIPELATRIERAVSASAPATDSPKGQRKAAAAAASTDGLATKAEAQALRKEIAALRKQVAKLGAAR